MLENVEDALEQYRKEMDNVSRMSYQIIDFPESVFVIVKNGRKSIYTDFD